MNQMSNEEVDELLKSFGIGRSKSESKEPNCYVCWDLGNYEISVLSDGTQMNRWNYSKKEIIDNLKLAQERDLDVTEVLLYRAQCPKCNEVFAEKHRELADVITNSKDEVARNDARFKLQKHWGLGQLKK